MSEFIKKLLIGLIILILVFILVSSRDFRTLLRQREQIHQLEIKLKKQLEINKNLKNEIFLAENNLTYIEKIARQKLGLIQQGEKIYKFVDAPSGHPGKK